METRRRILTDIKDGVFDHVFLGTPGDTFEDYFGESPSSVRPLRSVIQIEGFKRGLTRSETEELREANQLVSFSAAVMAQAKADEVGFIENPKPHEPITIFKMPSVAEILNMNGVNISDMDQCWYGCETARPTRLVHFAVSCSTMKGKQCSHPEQVFRGSRGREYTVCHPRVADLQSAKTRTDKGRYNRVRGVYGPEFCKALAESVWYTAQSKAGLRLPGACQREFQADRQTWPRRASQVRV